MKKISTRKSNRSQRGSKKIRSVPYSLVVIDMQRKFEAANSLQTIKAVKRLILKAIQDNAHICFAYFIKYGPTHRELTSLTRDYPNTSFVKAAQNDKSWSILKRFRMDNIRPAFVKTCGVNTDACVYETTLGLGLKLPKSQVLLIKPACNTYHNGLDYIGYRLSILQSENRNITVKF